QRPAQAQPQEAVAHAPVDQQLAQGSGPRRTADQEADGCALPVLEGAAMSERIAERTDTPGGPALAGGNPLAPSVRSAMGARPGPAFAAVRVPRDGAAAGAARALGARAFAVGTDVVFGADQFTLSTLPGQAMLAHELAHVVQQGEAGDAEPGRAE